MSPGLYSRRAVLRAGSIALAGGALPGCAPARDEYLEAANGLWRHAPGLPETRAGLFAELIRYATLAPSTYNSQCWRFQVAQDAITILPDLTRRSPAVDPDDHHLHISLGCAAENIVQAGVSIGLDSVVVTGPGIGDGVTVRLRLAPASVSQLAEAIPRRQTTRTTYDGKPVPVAEIRLLEKVAWAPGVTPVFITDAVQKRRLLELAAAADREWHADSAKLAELKRWTRFDDATALETRDGLAPRPTGRLSLPPPLGATLFDLLAASDRRTDRLVTELRTSPGLVAFVSAVDDRANWVATGRSFQRFALLSTALGIRHAWVNAPAESQALRPRLGMELGEPAGRPSLLLRYGYGPARPRSLRRQPGPEIAGPAGPGGDREDRFAPPSN